MIRGQVINREPIVELKLVGSGKATRQVTAIIDTGYNGYLTLPENEVRALGLLFVGFRTATLADGTNIRFKAFLAKLRWQGRNRDVLVSQGAGTPLIGMSLLNGSKLTIHAENGGEVLIEDLP